MMKNPQTLNDIKDNFFAKNTKYNEVKGNIPTIGEFYNINEDDEVWIMQCPKGADVSSLNNKKIKLPGRSNQDAFETIAVEYPHPVPHAFGHKNRKGHNSIQIVKVQGCVMLRSRLKSAAVPDETLLETPSGRVPMPAGIKIRHPLHGVDFKSKLEIHPEIAERLKLAGTISNGPTPISKSKSKSKRKEEKAIAIGSDSDVELVTQKKTKKKRKHFKDEIAYNSKKVKTNCLSDDIAEDLQWIQKL